MGWGYAWGYIWGYTLEHCKNEMCRKGLHLGLHFCPFLGAIIGVIMPFYPLIFAYFVWIEGGIIPQKHRIHTPIISYIAL